MIEKVLTRTYASAAAEELAYNEFTANVSITATAEATPTDVVAAPAIALDGTTAILVEFFSPGMITGAGASAFMIVNLWDDATNLGPWGFVQNNTEATGQTGMVADFKRRLTPAAGLHTYKARAYRGVANGTIYGGVGGGAGAYQPGFIRVTRVAGATLLSPSRGTSFPGSPLSGQLFTLTDSLTAPTYNWTFCYNGLSSSTYKWEYVSGASLTAYNYTTSDTYSTTGSWNFQANSPVITIPRAGDYQTTTRMGYANNAATAHDLYMGLGKNATADPPQTEPGNYMPAVNAIQGNVETMDVWLGLAQGDTLKQAYYLTAGSALLGGTSGIRGRTIELVPRRVI